MFDVITIGSATFDMFIRTTVPFNQPKGGDKILVEHIDHSVGGGGVNSAIALSRMGLKVATLVKLGVDPHAEMIYQVLDDENVKLIENRASIVPTSYSVIMNSTKEKDRVVYAFKGSADDLSFKDFKLDDIRSKWIYMATMMGKSFKTCEKIAKYAKKNKIKLLFNPSQYLASRGKKYLKTILETTTVLVLNLREAQELLNYKTDNDVELARKLIKLGPKIVAITEGKHGIFAYDGNCRYSLTPYPVKVVNTLGAGDAFTSGFLAGIIKSGDLSIALEIGMANAASVIQFIGTRNKLLSYEEAIDFIKKRKEKVLKISCELTSANISF